MAPIWRKRRKVEEETGEAVESDNPIAGILAREGLDADEIARRLNRSGKDRGTSLESLLEAARKIA